MDLTPKQQTSEAIRQANAILVVTGQRPSIDQVTGVVALGMILRKLGKKVTALVSDKIPPSITFLTDGQLDKSPEALRDFIIKLDLGRAEVDKLRYTMEGGKLNIHLTPFRGKFSSGDVSFDYGEPAAAGDHQYDLVVALGVPSRLKLDKVLEDSSLGSVPLLNLDFHRINENYGAVNLIEPTASSLSEMLVSLSESLQSGLIDEPIATVLLAGIVASTDRFTATHTTPKALTVAAQLMAAGGKQQQVIKALYRKDGKEARPGDRPSGPPAGGYRPSSHQSSSSHKQSQPPNQHPGRFDTPIDHSAKRPQAEASTALADSRPQTHDSSDKPPQSPSSVLPPVNDASAATGMGLDGPASNQPRADAEQPMAPADTDIDYPDFFTTTEP